MLKSQNVQTIDITTVVHYQKRGQKVRKTRIHRLSGLPEVLAVGAPTYFRTSNARRQSRSGKIGRPNGPKKRRKRIAL